MYEIMLVEDNKQFSNYTSDIVPIPNDVIVITELQMFKVEYRMLTTLNNKIVLIGKILK